MPIDPARMRAISDHNEKVTADVATQSSKIEHLDQRNVVAIAVEAKAWAANATELKANLDQQAQLMKQMRIDAQIQDQQQSESFHEKYRFFIETIKADIRLLFGSLEKYVDLPQGKQSRSWDNMTYDLEMDLKTLSAANTGKDLLSVEPLAMLLNYRDAVASQLLSSLLFNKAVLDWDLKSERAYADGPMVEMAEVVVNIFSQTASLPAKLRPKALPSPFDPGPFTCDKKQLDREHGRHGQPEKGAPVGPAAPAILTQMQCRLLAVLREMQSLDKGLRHMHFAEKVHLRNRDGTGKNGAVDELKKEIDKWFDKCSQLEKELGSSKGTSRQQAKEMEVESLNTKLIEKEAANKKRVTQIHNYEGDVQSLKYELAALQREKGELADQNSKIAKDNLPVIDKMFALVNRSKEGVDRLNQDSNILASMFRRQVQDIKRIEGERDDISRELTKVQKQLAVEREKNFVKEGELQKKETLYLRTMAARKCIQDSYHEQRDRIVEVEKTMDKRECDRQELLKVVEGRDGEIKQFEEDLRRAHHRIEEMKEQREMCVQEYKRLTGKNLDFSKFPVAPTIPA